LNEPVEIAVKCLPHHEGLALPATKSKGASGVDLSAAISEPITLDPLARTLIPTGIAISLPAGFEAQVRPRSGLALRHGITILNSPGTIDSDYRGEIQVILINLSQEPFQINRGDRIAQMVIARSEKVGFKIIEELDVTLRGKGGFGHTGVSHT